MRHFIAPILVSLLVTMLLIIAYDLMVAQPRLVIPEAPGVSPTIIQIDPTPSNPDADASLTPVVEPNADGSIPQIYQIEGDVPSLDPDYESPTDDLETWEELTPEQQAEIEEKSKPIY